MQYKQNYTYKGLSLVLQFKFLSNPKNKQANYYGGGS